MAVDCNNTLAVREAVCKNATDMQEMITLSDDGTLTSNYGAKPVALMVKEKVLFDLQKLGIQYVWENQTERDAQTGMTLNQDGYQIDNNSVYRHNGSAWEFRYYVGIQTVETIAELNALVGTDGELVIVRDLDRGGSFIYDSTKVAQDNQGTNFNGWIRQYNGAVNVKWFGAVGDGVVDDTSAIQNAVDNHSNLFAPKGTYLVSTIQLSQNKTITGDGYLCVIKTSGTKAFTIKNDVSYTETVNIVIMGLRIDAVTENIATGIRGINDTTYIYGITIYNVTFSLRLKYGMYGNFIQSRIGNSIFGKYGSATTRMTTGIYIVGVALAQANINSISECLVSDVSGVGIYLGSAWGTNINGTTIEVCGAECVHVDGGLNTNITNCYMERAYEGNTPAGGESIIKTSNNAVTSDGIYALNVIGCTIQSSAGVQGGYLIRTDGSSIVKVQSCGIGGLSAHPIQLATNLDKIVFGNDNYYPSGFTGFTTQQITYPNQYVRGILEQSDGSADTTKVIRHTNAVDNGTLLRLDAAKAQSSSYNFLVCKENYTGTNETMHYLLGNGQAYHKRNLILGDTGDWDKGHLQLGNYHIWVDNTGKLRIKSSTPTSSTDGTVVGTQA